MRFTQITAAGFLAFAASAAAVSHQTIVNHCLESIFLTLTDGSGATSGPIELTHTKSYNRDIVGTGNSVGITKSTDYYGSPKLIFGTSTSNGILYWSANNVDGDPFAGEAFNVTSGGLAGQTNKASSQVFAGNDKNVPLVLSACYHRA
nr:antigenic thaumatin-like protein [Quercus suber]